MSTANALSATKMDLIAALVQRELKETASLTNFLTDYSNLAGKGVKQIEIPKLSSFEVRDRNFGALSNIESPLTDGTDVIALNKNKIVTFAYDSADESQSTIDYLMEATRRAASAHGRQVNSDIVDLWDAVAGFEARETVGDIAINDILDMREFLMENHADMNRAALIIAADQEKAMLKLAEFSRYEYRGNGTAPVVTGQIGFVYGVPVIINQQIPKSQAFMVEVSGSGIAFQRNPSVAEQQEVRYGSGGRIVTVDQLYGLGGLQLGEASADSGKSPLVAKLNDLSETTEI